MCLLHQSHRSKFDKIAAQRARVIAKKTQIQREGKHAVGIWSEYALDETRSLFWDSIRRGTGLAKQVTKNQAPIDRSFPPSSPFLPPSLPPSLSPSRWLCSSCLRNARLQSRDIAVVVHAAAGRRPAPKLLLPQMMAAPLSNSTKCGWHESPS